MSKFILYIVFVFFSFGVLAQSHSLPEEFKIHSVDRAEKYCYTRKGIEVEKGERENCEISHQFLTIVFTDLLKGKIKYTDIPRFNYCTDNSLIKTDIQNIWENIISLYELTPDSSSCEEILGYLNALKQKDYEIVMPTMELIHTCYLFWVKEKLIIACVSNIHSKEKNAKIVKLVREALDNSR
ncbi:hypothetical protein [Porphyromonas macacae]|uniref:hypothetical protein n=1 Tax=Porphyromonas macacae TaxID=28115 RepID=UPI0035A08508